MATVATTTSEPEIATASKATAVATVAIQPKWPL
jgi:hypothetical protein